MKAWLVCLNVAGWPIIQIGLSATFQRMPERWFDVHPLTYAGKRRAAREIKFYRTWFAIRSWKSALPDGGAWTAGGFPRKKIKSRDPAFLKRYAMETRRGEAAHWMMLAMSAIFFLWNPLWACVVMAAYGLLTNVPCILAQRYNRAMILSRILRDRASSSESSLL